MRFESIREWEKATLEKAAEEENTTVIDLLIDLLFEWDSDSFLDFIGEKAEKYNLILEEQEEE